MLLVKDDQTKYGVELSDDIIASMSKLEYNKLIKYKVRQFALNELKTIQSEHIKVKHILYESSSEPQEYLKDKHFNNRLSSLLYNLRCESVKDLKNNFRKMYNDKIQCRMKCKNEIDSQQHILECHEIITHLSSNQKELLKDVKYEHLFGNPQDQLKITKMFKILLSTRERLLEQDQEPACHGNNSGPVS